MILTRLVCKLVSICFLLQQLLGVSIRKDGRNLISHRTTTFQFLSGDQMDFLGLYDPAQRPQIQVPLLLVVGWVVTGKGFTTCGRLH